MQTLRLSERVTFRPGIVATSVNGRALIIVVSDHRVVNAAGASGRQNAVSIVSLAIPPDAIDHDAIPGKTLPHAGYRWVDLRAGAGASCAASDARMGTLQRRGVGRWVQVEDQRLAGKVGSDAAPGSESCTWQERGWRHGDGSPRVQRLNPPRPVGPPWRNRIAFGVAAHVYRATTFFPLCLDG